MRVEAIDSFHVGDDDIWRTHQVLEELPYAFRNESELRFFNGSNELVNVFIEKSVIRW